MEILPLQANDAGCLALTHFGEAYLGNQARTRRLVASADRVLQHPHGTVPQKMGGTDYLAGLYGLLESEWVTHASVLEAHRQHTLQQMRQHPVVLIVGDSTELDYAHIDALAEALGPIGNGNRRGYICHNSLAITPQKQILGLPSQILHRRREVPKGESPQAKREDPRRESRLWVRAAEQIGPAPNGCLWVNVNDRGADTYEYAAHQRRHGLHFVIRASKDRNLEGEDHIGADRIHRKLREYARDLPVLGQRRVELAAVAGKSPARVAQVSVAAGAARLKAPHFVRGEADEPHLDVWVIHVREIDPPPGQEALEWILLTDLVTETFEQACERIDWYECRPVIEDLHKGKKTGCAIEKVQFEKVEHLEPYIALVSVVATLLLGMRQEARMPEAEHTPATERWPAVYVEVLSLSRYGEVRDLSVKDFYLNLARLGGHVKRRADAWPGWLTLWRGWSRLQDMVRGAQLVKRRAKHKRKT